MPSPDSNFDAGQDAELRAVPLPDGLLRRLRRTALADDEGLDTALRRVPVPAWLLGRLQRVVLADDDGLDQALRRLPLPARLADRLRLLPLEGDQQLDAAVRHVPVPPAILGRCRRLPNRGLSLARVTHWVTAASLMIAIGLSYVGAMIGFLVAAYSPDQAPRPVLASWILSEPDPLEPFVHGRWTREEPEELANVVDVHLPAPLRELELMNERQPVHSPLAEVTRLFASADPLLDAGSFHWGVFAIHELFDTQRELRTVASLRTRGIRAPLAPGYDRAFLTKHGVHPFVYPAVDTRLGTSEVPLGTGTSSYELTRRYLKGGKLPPRDQMRTEEFLAAIDYHFPQPEWEALGVYAMGGPSPFRSGGRLLQIGVRARELGDLKRPATRLTLAVDVSVSMHRGGRLEMVRRAVGKLAGWMRPEDRVSLVAFSEYADVVVEDIERHEGDQLRAAAAMLQVQSSTNVGAGLREAYAVARHSARADKRAHCGVLLTDGLTELDDGTANRIEQRLAEAAERGIVLHVIDLGQDEQAEEPDSQLARFARSGGGGVHPAANADQIGWALREVLTGKSQLVAADARLKVVFNPTTVVAYRLLGHEPGAKTAPLQADFHAGQSATALYELQLRPNSWGHVATVKLTWKPPAGGEIRHASRGIRRSQFTPSFVEAPLSLQAAALAAQTAEVLRDSVFVRNRPRPGTLANVLELAREVDTRLYRWPSFVEFISLIEQARKVK